MKQVFLVHDDFNNDTHPFIWEEFLEYFLTEDDLPEDRNDYPDMVKIYVTKAEV